MMRWDITLTSYLADGKRVYKVTRRLPGMSVSETRIFKSKKSARKQFREWLLC